MKVTCKAIALCKRNKEKKKTIFFQHRKRVFLGLSLVIFCHVDLIKKYTKSINEGGTLSFLLPKIDEFCVLVM